MIRVVCGIIWQDHRVFIARRKQEKSMGGYWEFPGGKIEMGENPESALTRELEEELGMIIKVKKHFASNIHHYENFTIELIAYECEFISASFNLTDHDKWEFINPENLNKYNIAPADIPFIELINNEF